MNTLEIILVTLAWLFSIFSFLPATPFTHWFFRFFDFVRVQLLMILGLILLGLFFVLDFDGSLQIGTLVATISAVAYQLIIISPYQAFLVKLMKRATQKTA